MPQARIGYKEPGRRTGKILYKLRHTMPMSQLWREISLRSTMGFAPLTFTGVSTYSADFQKILERTVAIASQPITQLQAEQTEIFQQKSLATGLQSVVAGLATAITSLSDLGQSKALSGSSSNSSKVSVGTVTANNPASYTISEITSSPEPPQPLPPGSPTAPPPRHRPPAQ
jgi:hypothetical protein